jgi:hypothetical protein
MSQDAFQRNSLGENKAKSEVGIENNHIKTQKYRVRDCFKLPEFKIDSLNSPDHH